jgi:hypothetical protein
MREESIAEVRIDELDRLFVRPAETAFHQIHRAAMGIEWDEEAQALVSPASREWAHLRRFEQILAAAADEHGAALTLRPTTRWTGVAPDVRRDRETFAQSEWLQEFAAERAKNDTVSWHRYQLEQALSQAAPYWKNGQFAEYAQALAPIRDLLSPAQLKRLSIAESRTRR